MTGLLILGTPCSLGGSLSRKVCMLSFRRITSNTTLTLRPEPIPLQPGEKIPDGGIPIGGTPAKIDPNGIPPAGQTIAPGKPGFRPDPNTIFNGVGTVVTLGTAYAYLKPSKEEGAGPDTFGTTKYINDPEMDDAIEFGRDGPGFGYDPVTGEADPTWGGLYDPVNQRWYDEGDAGAGAGAGAGGSEPVFDEESGLYYDQDTGGYYDPATDQVYDPVTQEWTSVAGAAGASGGGGGTDKQELDCYMACCETYGGGGCAPTSSACSCSSSKKSCSSKKSTSSKSSKKSSGSKKKKLGKTATCVKKTQKSKYKGGSVSSMSRGSCSTKSKKSTSSKKSSSSKKSTSSKKKKTKKKVIVKPVACKRAKPKKSSAFYLAKAYALQAKEAKNCPAQNSPPPQYQQQYLGPQPPYSQMYPPYGYQSPGYY